MVGQQPSVTGARRAWLSCSAKAPLYFVPAAPLVDRVARLVQRADEDIYDCGIVFCNQCSHNPEHVCR